MTTSPSEPVDNAQMSDDSELSSGGVTSQDDTMSYSSDDTDYDQDAEPTSTAPAENNPTVPSPPD